MKKLVLISSAVILSASVFAQNYSPAAGALPAGSTTASYNQVIDFTMPASATIDVSTFGIPAGIPGIPSTVNATVSSVNLAVTGLPSGLTAVCSVVSCDFSPNVAGTITISGTPTVGGTFTINIVSLTSGTTDALPVIGAVTFPGAVVTPLGTQQAPAAPQVFDGGPYTMDVAGPSAVQELSTTSFDVIQNVPNPFTGNTQIKFSLPSAANVDFAIFDMIGKRVHAEKIQGQAKSNVINFSADKLAPGTYFYSLTNGTKTITKKMIVAGK